MQTVKVNPDNSFRVSYQHVTDSTPRIYMAVPTEETLELIGDMSPDKITVQGEYTFYLRSKKGLTPDKDVFIQGSGEDLEVFASDLAFFDSFTSKSNTVKKRQTGANA